MTSIHGEHTRTSSSICTRTRANIVRIPIPYLSLAPILVLVDAAVDDLLELLDLAAFVTVAAIQKRLLAQLSLVQFHSIGIQATTSG